MIGKLLFLPLRSVEVKLLSHSSWFILFVEFCICSIIIILLDYTVSFYFSFWFLCITLYNRVLKINKNKF